MDWYVGQKVIVVSRRARTPDQEGTITKIARKYLTVEIESSFGGRLYSTEKEYEIATGREKGSKQWSPESVIETPEIRAEKNERAELEKRLRDHGFERRLGQGWHEVSTAKMEAILAIMDAD